MYLAHFGLTEYPFQLTSDFDFLYMSQSHARAKAYLDYTVVSKDGFVVITGEIGAGKTTLLNKMIHEHQEDIVLAHINQTQLTDVEFLQAVVYAFGMDAAGAGKVELMNRLRAFLLKQAELDRPVVLAVDEAQSLSFPVLEEIRMLSGIEFNKAKLLSVVLMGQPELDHVISSPELEQLSQRVKLRFHLGPLRVGEARNYVLHRLSVAGDASGSLFEEDAYDVVEYYAGGIPRLINSLCDMSLLTAFVDGEYQISAKAVEVAAKELGWPPFAERPLQAGGRAMTPMPGGPGAETSDMKHEMVEIQQAVQSAAVRVADGFEGLRQELQSIQHQLADVLQHLDRDR